MKVLLISPYLPYPPNSGGKIRIWEEIRHLGQNHDLHLVSLIDPAELKYAGSIHYYCRRVNLVEHPFFRPPPDEMANLPLIVLRHWAESMQKSLAWAARRSYDLIIFEHIYTAQYQDLFEAGPTVLAEHNIESSILGQTAAPGRMFGAQTGRITDWKAQAAKMHLAAYENEIWPKFPRRLTVSQEDKAEIDSRCPSGKTLVIENGVDAESYRLLDECGSRNILFMGAMNYYPNIDGALFFTEHIFPLVRKLDKRVKLVIAGRNPAEEIMQLNKTPGVEVIPSPLHMDRVAEKCGLTVVPLRIGGGTRLKILYAMAIGLPVITTSLGCAGLAVENDQHLLIEDQIESFAKGVVALLDDRNKRLKFRQNGRALVEQKYHWPKILAKLDQYLLS
jgi:glycosyltransferase involved in cell wall biosynthesis